MEEFAPGATGRLLRLQERVIDQAETEQHHRHSLEDRESSRRSKGQFMGIGAWVVGLGVAYWSAHEGFQALAVVIAGGELAVVVGALVTGRLPHRGGKQDPEAP